MSHLFSSTSPGARACRLAAVVLAVGLAGLFANAWLLTPHTDPHAGLTVPGPIGHWLFVLISTAVVFLVHYGWLRLRGRHGPGVYAADAGAITAPGNHSAAQAQLDDRASAARMRALLEESMDAIMLSDPENGLLLECNPAAEELFGRSEEEMKALTREDVFDFDDPAVTEFLHQRDTTGRARGILQIFRPDGARVPVEVTTALFRTESGQLRSSVILRDISEHQRREMDLRASEERFRAIFENSPDAILIHDPESGRNLDANPAAERLLGTTREAIIGGTRAQHTDIDDPAVQAFIAQRNKTGRARVSCRMIRGDGTRIPVDITSATFRDQQGRMRAINLIRDIREQLEHEERLRQSEQRFRIIADHTGQAVYELNLETGALNWAGNCKTMFGIESWNMERMSADQRLEFVPEPDRTRVARTFRDVISRGGPYRLEYRLDTADGRTIEVEDRGVLLPDNRHLYGVIQNVTEKRELLRQLELVAAAFRSAEEALLICDSAFVTLDANEAYENLLGLGREQIIGSQPPFLEIGDQGPRIREKLRQTGHWHGELLQRGAEGDVITTRAGISEIRGSQQEMRFLVVNLQDISQLREIQRKVDYLAYNDALTGLPNRRALEQWFNQFVKQHAGQRTLALVYMDLDRFKAINESFGHSSGDHVLTEIARRLDQGCGRQDYVVRVGGDDFVVLLADIADHAAAVARGNRLLRAITQPLHQNDRRLYTSATAGVALYPTDGTTLEDLLRRADAAHAAAKRRGRNRIGAYDRSMQRQVEEQAMVESHLREAISGGELSVDYQPIVDLVDGRILGLEALARWHSPQLGAVDPGLFIEVAEETGLIIELGGWVLDTVCARIRQWLDEGVGFGSVAVNFSPAQFQHSDLLAQLHQALDRYRLEGRHLRIEITESILMLDPERAIIVLEQMSDMGLAIAVDDFGTGYSSMAYLRQFPVHCIKLDGTFVENLPHKRADVSIVKSIIDLAGALDMKLIAEGIETEEQRECLRRWGCREAQGFYFNCPQSVDAITELLRSGRSLPLVE